MNTFFWPKSKLHLADLFSPGLETVGIYEYISAAHTTSWCRCLTDGQNGLWVYGDEEGVETMTRSRGNEVALVCKFSRQLNVEFIDSEGRHYGGSGDQDAHLAPAIHPASRDGGDAKDAVAEISGLGASEVVTSGPLVEEDFVPPSYRQFTDAELETAIQSIDVDNAEVEWCYADTSDPYHLGFRSGQIGRSYYVRAPANDLWIEFCDLPDDLRSVLWAKFKHQLAFPAGLGGAVAGRG